MNDVLIWLRYAAYSPSFPSRPPTSYMHTHTHTHMRARAPLKTTCHGVGHFLLGRLIWWTRRPLIIIKSSWLHKRRFASAPNRWALQLTQASRDFSENRRQAKVVCSTCKWRPSRWHDKWPPVVPSTPSCHAQFWGSRAWFLYLSAFLQSLLVVRGERLLNSAAESMSHMIARFRLLAKRSCFEFVSSFKPDLIKTYGRWTRIYVTGILLLLA